MPRERDPNVADPMCDECGLHGCYDDCEKCGLYLCECECCTGHPAGPFDPMGETVYCDGSCKRQSTAGMSRVELAREWVNPLLSAVRDEVRRGMVAES